MKFGLQPELQPEPLGGKLRGTYYKEYKGITKRDPEVLDYLKENLTMDKEEQNYLENLFIQQMENIVNSLDNNLVTNKKEIIGKINEYGFSFPQYAQCEEDPFLMSLVPLCTFVIDQLYVE